MSRRTISNLIIAGLVLGAALATCTFCSNLIAPVAQNRDGWTEATALMQQVTASSRLMAFLVTIAFGPTCVGLVFVLVIVLGALAWARLHRRGGAA